MSGTSWLTSTCNLAWHISFQWIIFKHQFRFFGYSWIWCVDHWLIVFVVFGVFLDQGGSQMVQRSQLMVTSLQPLKFKAANKCIRRAKMLVWFLWLWVVSQDCGTRPTRETEWPEAFCRASYPSPIWTLSPCYNSCIPDGCQKLIGGWT